MVIDDIFNHLIEGEGDPQKLCLVLSLMITCLVISVVCVVRLPDGAAEKIMQWPSKNANGTRRVPPSSTGISGGLFGWRWNNIRQPKRYPHSLNNVANDGMMHRSLSSIGRFALRSQTRENPSIISFFVGLSNEKGSKELDVQDFGTLVRCRVVTKHERFRSRICSNDDRFFEIMKGSDVTDFISSLSHPVIYHHDLASRVHESLTSKLDVRDRLWEAQISTGPMGSSGAIRRDVAAQLKDTHDRETVVIFRVHHALCDGVSLSVAMGDLCDESKELDALVAERKRKHKEKLRKRSILQRVIDAIHIFVFYLFGSAYALWLQAWRTLVSVNPFEQVMEVREEIENNRSSTWRYMDSLEGMKRAAHRVVKTATVNDLAVACVTGALYRQLAEHQKEFISKGIQLRIPNHLNIVIPYHLHGGVIPKGDSLGNKIGAFVTAIPSRGDRSPTAWLKQVSRNLSEGKITPAPLIAWWIAKVFSNCTPLWVSKKAIRHGNGHASIVVSNVRGFPIPTHWSGKRLEHVSAFLPLPPGIPVGVVIHSHDGSVSFTVEAERRAVPDVNRFADWVIDEYIAMQAAALIE